MAALTTAGKGCEPLYEDSGGGRITDSPPLRGQPVQTPDYSAHAHRQTASGEDYLGKARARQ